MRGSAVIAGCAAFVLSATASVAASLEVVPTSLDIPARGGAAQLRLLNHGDEAVDVQIEGFAWKQDGTESFVESDAVVLSPPLAHLKARSSQIVRLLVSPGGQELRERAFRIVVSQLPDPNAKIVGAQVLLQFNVPLFAGDGALSGANLSWSVRRAGGGLRLDVRNSGTRRAKMVGLAIKSGGENRKVAQGALVYVLAGASRSWSIPGASGGTLEGYDDIAARSFTLPLAGSD
jgi:fimbrial chaperone protein